MIRRRKQNKTKCLVQVYWYDHPYASLRAENPFHGNRSQQTSPTSTATHESALQNRQLCSLSCALQLSQLRQDTGSSEHPVPSKVSPTHCLHPLCSVQMVPPSLGSPPCSLWHSGTSQSGLCSLVSSEISTGKSRFFILYLKTNPGRGKEDEETKIKLLPVEDIIGMCWGAG